MKSVKRITDALRLLAFLLLATSCDGANRKSSALSNWLGLTEASSRCAVVDLLIDVSPGSPASSSTISATIDSLLALIAERPGSSLRIWVLGETLETTHILANVESTSPSRPSRAIVEAHVARFLREERPRLLAAVIPALGQDERTSPIAEGITRIAIETTRSGVERQIYALTDGREVSKLGNGGPMLDFECGTLPTPASFVGRVHRAGLLLPGSLRGARVTLCYLRPDAVEGGRCSISIAKYEQLVTLWRTALESSGASVEILTDKPQRVLKGEPR